jgi:nitrite reductase (NO-forming)
VALGRHSAVALGRHSAVALGAAMLAVAATVALGAGHTGRAATSTVTTGGGSRTVAVRLQDMRIDPSVIRVPVGTHLVLEVTNADAMRHDLHLDGGPQTPLLSQGQTVRLDAGVVRHTIAAWCTVPGHRAAGMAMTVQAVGTTSTSDGPMAMPMPDRSTAASPVIDFHADPGPDWRPYDPALRPAPGATEQRLTLTVRDTPTEVAPGVRQTLWTYNGTAPGPVLHGHVGDLFTITLVNDSAMGHGIDFHAGSLAPDAAMRTIGPGQSLTYQFLARYSGAWLYHCSTMPMSLHLANGMFGAVIIDPPDLDKADQEFVMVQSELYLGPQDGVADPRKIAEGRPDAVVFNGYVDQYDHAPIKVRAGERIRVWVVDAGPQRATSFHVVGAQFDTVFKEGAFLLRPDNPEHGAAQTLDLAPGQGGFVEFVLAAPGHYPFVTHAMADAERGAHGIFAAS